MNYVGWSIDEYKTLEHLKQLQDKYSITSYRKRVYQIRKFLTFLHVEWAKDIKPPAEPYYIPKRVTKCELKNTLSYFEGNRFNKQIKSIILLGSTSGIRPEELYQLDVKDIDLDKRTVYINHNPSNGQSTKTKMSRVSFFSEKAKQALVEYLESFDDNDGVKHPFNKHCISKLFRDSPIQVKDLRKYFSQEWDRRGGPTSIKKILMGHSLKGDVDLMHYNCQSEEDLKKIYDKVMGV
ncbi:MAG: tyrosine-type recombinase/integrase [Thermoplasmatales archaeon]|nr:tyrosine-type recombinase/integrase [Thermoplasmatales archaeon]